MYTEAIYDKEYQQIWNQKEKKRKEEEIEYYKQANAAKALLLQEEMDLMQEISDIKIKNARAEEQLKLTESKNKVELAEQESIKTQIASKTEAIKAKGISLMSLAESELKINQDALRKLDEDIKETQKNKQATLIANAETYIIELEDKLEKAKKIINKENEDTAKNRFLKVKSALENPSRNIKVAEDSGTDFQDTIDNLKKSTLKMLKLRALKQIIDDDVVIQEILTKARNVGTDLRTLVNELNSDSTSAPQESYTETVKISIAETLGDEYADMFETVETVEEYNPFAGMLAQTQAQAQASSSSSTRKSSSSSTRKSSSTFRIFRINFYSTTGTYTIITTRIVTAITNVTSCNSSCKRIQMQLEHAVML